MRPSEATTTPGGPNTPPGGIRPWLKLLIGLALILFFMFGVGSLSKLIPGARRMAEVIDERGLRATALWYTDFEESAEGAEYIRHGLESRPRPP